MRFRNTLLLLLVLLGLGAYVYFVEMPEAEKEAKKEKLVDFQTDDVTEIVLTYPDREVVLLKADGVWRITKPIEAEADEVTVKGILSMLNTAEVSKALEGEISDLSPYGLDKPSATVALKAGDEALPVVKLGKTTPVGSSAYAARGDDRKVLLTTASVRSGVDKSIKDLRNKNIFRFTDDSVRRIEVKGEGKELVLVKSGDSWKIESPGPYDADATTVRSYLSTLRALRATDFPDEKASLADYGLTTPRLTVTLTLGEGGAQQTLLVGGSNEKKEVYVKNASGPVVYTVGEWVSRDLDKPVADFRDKTVLAFDKDKVKAIEVGRRDGTGYTLSRADDGQWKLEKAEAPVAQNALTQLVNDAAALKGHAIAADGVSDLGAYGLEPAAITMRVVGADGAEVGTILLGQREVEGKREYTAGRRGSDTVLLLRDYNYTRLDKSVSDLLAKPTPAPGGTAPVPPPVDLGDDEGQVIHLEDDLDDDQLDIDDDLEDGDDFEDGGDVHEPGE
jgi:hypothetical protein